MSVTPRLVKGSSDVLHSNNNVDGPSNGATESAGEYIKRILFNLHCNRIRRNR